ncbi:TetR/AcrR family transcriptional regulator [Corynebacterium sp. H130]|uniref:TetR/AcrR family transcriptional regulator n=1 Tax=Corynebacterium sp. H130 TaxID=3133444 RepID=UPI0030966AAC
MRADALRRREAILEAARTVFADGPDSGTLEEVARVAGVGIATLYRNFPDKHALLSAGLERLLERIIDVQKAALAEFETNPAAALHNYAHDLVELGLAPLIMGTSASMGKDFLARFSTARKNLTTNNRTIIELAKRSNLVTDDVTPRFFIAGLIQAARPAAATFLPPVTQLEKKMVDVFLAGIRPPQSPTLEA